jgi:hypothetical protein
MCDIRKVVLIFIFAVKLHAAFDSANANVFLGNASSSFLATRHFFAAFMINPAVSAAVSHSNIGIYYHRPHNLAKLHKAGILANFHFRGFGAGMAISSFGNDLYQENQLIVNLSKGFVSNKFFLGLNFRWNSLYVRSYDSDDVMGVDFGLQYLVSHSMMVGFSLLNFNRPQLHGSRKEIPLITSWGLAWEIDEYFTSYLSVQKDSWFPVSLRFGLIFKPNSFLLLRTGFTSYPSVPSIGFQLTGGWVSINYAFQYHFDLGSTHFWGLSVKKTGGKTQ